MVFARIVKDGWVNNSEPLKEYCVILILVKVFVSNEIEWDTFVKYNGLGKKEPFIFVGDAFFWPLSVWFTSYKHLALVVMLNCETFIGKFGATLMAVVVAAQILQELNRAPSGRAQSYLGNGWPVDMDQWFVWSKDGFSVIKTDACQMVLANHHCFWCGIWSQCRGSWGPGSWQWTV